MPAAVVAVDDARLVEALRDGDERSFTELLVRYGPAMRRVAWSIVHDRELADEIVQETWLGVVAGIHRFQGRSLLRTWIFRILTNTAISRATREARSAPFSALGSVDAEDELLDADRFLAPGSRSSGSWASPARRWSELPEAVLATWQTVDSLTGAILGLPPLQRAVVTMRDVEGYDAREVCRTLGLSAANQRVLLHRARSKLRAALCSFVRDD